MPLATRYHIANSGKPAACKAQSDQACPRNTVTPHFPNKDTALFYVEQQEYMMQQLGVAQTPVMQPAELAEITRLNIWHEDDINQFKLPVQTLEAFGNGDCWLLADELHKRTGWPLVAVGNEDEWEVEPDKRGWVHVAVLHPDGRVIDVQGAHNMGEWLDDWAVYEPNAEAFDMTPALYQQEERKHKTSPGPVVDKILATLSLVVQLLLLDSTSNLEIG